jgi:hypothetical protein
MFLHHHVCRQLAVKNSYTEFHKSLTNGLVAGTGPLTNGSTGGLRKGLKVFVSTLGFLLRKEH